LAPHHNNVPYDIQSEDKEERTDDRKEFVEPESFGDFHELNLPFAIRLESSQFGQHLADCERRNVVGGADQGKETENRRPDEVPKILHTLD